jgi:hypothetical protein
VVVPAAQRRRVPLTAPASGGAIVALRLPRVARLADVTPDNSASGWSDWLLRERYGLSVAVVSGPEIAAGALAGRDVLVVPDDASSGSDLSTAALAAVQAWVRAGGTLVGWRSRGLAVAQAASVTAVQMARQPRNFQVPGIAVRVALDPTDPVAAGEASESWVFNTGDPVLDARGARVVASYPPGERFFVSGYATGTDGLRGTPTATDESVNRGRVVLFAFDPVFRGYVEATQRLVGNALLAPAPGGGRRSRATAPPRPVDPSALVRTAAAPPDAVVQVAAEDEAALLAAARDAGVPTGFTLARDLTTVTLHVPNPGALDPEQRPWTRRLPAALAARGVRVLFAML